MASVIYFDGICNLCNGFVRYVIRQDKQGQFRFATLQSDYAQNRGFDIPREKDGTLQTVLVEWRGKLLRDSDAVLRILRALGGLHHVFIVGYVIPRPIRDGLYRWLARRRYLIFGKTDQCELPAPDIAWRFVDTASGSSTVEAKG